MPKMEEDDIIDQGPVPTIAAPKGPAGPSLTADMPSGFGGGFGSPAAAPSSTGFGSAPLGGNTMSTGGFGSIGAVSPGAQTAPASTVGQAAGAMHSGGESTVKLDKDAQDWINKKWRPVMGWVYMLTCTMDFVLFPILWSLLQALSKGSVTSQWQPLTLQGAGLYHIAMGAVLGIAAYGRTKEKVEGKA
jgi:hypothetical protein